MMPRLFTADVAVERCGPIVGNMRASMMPRLFTADVFIASTACMRLPSLQ